MKFNFRWGKNNKQEMTPELTERKVNVYQHSNPIRGAKHLGEKKCSVCGKWFKPTHHRQLMCSDECRKVRSKQYHDEWRARKAAGISATIYEGKCAICGEKFTTNYKQQVTCSKECRAIHKQKKKSEWGKEHYAEIYARRMQRKQAKVEPAEQVNERKETTKVNTVEIVDRRAGYKPSATLTDRVSVKKCAICGKAFMPYRNTQILCGDGECRKEYARRYTREWAKTRANSKPEEQVREQAHEQVANSTQETAVSNRRWKMSYKEVAVVVRNLVEAGVDDDVVAKYLQATFTK